MIMKTIHGLPAGVVSSNLSNPCVIKLTLMIISSLLQFSEIVIQVNQTRRIQTVLSTMPIQDAGELKGPGKTWDEPG